MLVPQPDGSERVKVLDFGIARVTLADAPRDSTHLTKVGAVMGTVAYMSPEQALGEDVDERTDLYALGVIVHEMITGNVPFDAPTAAQILAKQITEVPPALPPGVPAKLGILVGELLKKIRIERPPSARAVLQRLDGLDSASKPAPAKALPSPDRRRALYAIGAGAALLGILGVVALSNGEEQSPTPEALDSAAPITTGSSARPAAASPSDARDTLGKRRSEPADAGPAVSPAASVAKPSTSPSGTATGSKSSTKKRTQSGDSSKRRTGPGGIYIPPPKDWF
jgi:serine/threonine-protein kinase